MTGAGVAGGHREAGSGIVGICRQSPEHPWTDTPGERGQGNKQPGCADPKENMKRHLWPNVRAFQVCRETRAQYSTAKQDGQALAKLLCKKSQL